MVEFVVIVYFDVVCYCVVFGFECWIEYGWLVFVDCCVVFGVVVDGFYEC